jgi:deoxyadenosine/deoxycytidine kinase
VPEPVTSWEKIKDEKGISVVENFYKNQKKCAFKFQIMAWVTRSRLTINAVKRGKYKVLITERSVQTDMNIFAKMLFDDGTISKDEYEIYLMCVECFSGDLPLDGIIYVNATPKICLQRITERKRKGEVIPIKYLNRLHKYHENWIGGMTRPVLTINANTDIKLHKHVFDGWIMQIHDWINQKHLMIRMDWAGSTLVDVVSKSVNTPTKTPTKTPTNTDSNMVKVILTKTNSISDISPSPKLLGNLTKNLKILV